MKSLNLRQPKTFNFKIAEEKTNIQKIILLDKEYYKQTDELFILINIFMRRWYFSKLQNRSLEIMV